MSIVVDLPVVTKLATDVTRLLAKASGAQLTEAIVIGRDKDGQLYFAASNPDGGDALWLIEHAKLELLKATA